MKRSALAVLMMLLLLPGLLLPWQRGDAALGSLDTAADHPVLAAVIALALLVGIGTWWGRVRVVPIALAVGALGLSMLAADAMSSAYCWDGVDASGRPVGGCGRTRPMGPIFLVVDSLVLLAAAGLQGLRRWRQR